MMGFPRRCRRFVALLLLGLGAIGTRAADIVQFTVRVTDGAGGSMAARVLVRDSAGGSHVPPVATTVNIGPDTWFLCDAAARLDVPAVDYSVEVERGPEFTPARAELTGWNEVYASHCFHGITSYYPVRVVRTRTPKLIVNLANELTFPNANNLIHSPTWISAEKLPRKSWTAARSSSSCSARVTNSTISRVIRTRS